MNEPQQNPAPLDRMAEFYAARNNFLSAADHFRRMGTAYGLPIDLVGTLAHHGLLPKLFLEDVDVERLSGLLSDLNCHFREALDATGLGLGG
ncbi:hypothetical protein OC846_006505 [Tilletia horrida]|uniref:Uncharacterized protein n=1 Tax=Tilletia horrida TaxID=155126 RepID=A0AAN6JV01_9BASI|nr:hypothetical protein OC846_006505 [Tilletia horrida]